MEDAPTGQATPSIEPADLARLRRFVLAISVVLLTYSIAAVELVATETIHPLGVPLEVGNPERLGFGLALAVLYGTARFTYFGFVLGETPWERRRRELAAVSIGRGYRAITPRNVPNRPDAVAQLTAYYRSKLPRVPWFRVSLDTVPEGDETAQDVGHPRP